MSYTEAVVTGLVFASFSTIQTFIINRILIRPLDKKWTELEKWMKEKISKTGE